MYTSLCTFTNLYWGGPPAGHSIRSGEEADSLVMEMRQLLKSEQHTAETVVQEVTDDGGELPEDAINAGAPQTWRQAQLQSGE